MEHTMTIQEIIDQLLAFCEQHGKDPNEAKVMIDYGCEYAHVESVGSYRDYDGIRVVLN
jgi:hypothetical protein